MIQEVVVITISDTFCKNKLRRWSIVRRSHLTTCKTLSSVTCNGWGRNLETSMYLSRLPLRGDCSKFLPGSLLLKISMYCHGLFTSVIHVLFVVDVVNLLSSHETQSRRARCLCAGLENNLCTSTNTDLHLNLRLTLLDVYSPQNDTDPDTTVLSTRLYIRTVFLLCCY